MADHRSGIHLTGEDSGYPVAAPAEQEPHKDGTGADPWPHAEAIDGSGNVTASGEVQQVTDSGGATSNFTLTVGGQTTSNLNKTTATAAQVKTAIEALSSVEVDDFTVSGPTGGPWTIAATETGQFGDAAHTAITGDGVGVNEIQTLTASGTPPAGDDFKLTFSGQQTAAITYDAVGHHPTAAEVDAALEALSNIGAGEVTCGGGPLDTTPVTVAFSGTLAEADVPALVSDDAEIVVSTGTPGQAGPTVTVAVLAAGS